MTTTNDSPPETTPEHAKAGIDTELDQTFRVLEGHEEQTPQETSAPLDGRPDAAPGSLELPTPPAATERHTRRGHADTTAPAALRRWSEVLLEVPEHDRRLLVQNFSDAATTGQFLAVPLTERFRVSYRVVTGQTRTVTLDDEAIQWTPKFQAWVQQQIRENEYEVLGSKAGFRVDFERLASGELDLQRLSKMRQTKGRRAAEAHSTEGGSQHGVTRSASRNSRKKRAP